MVSPASRVHRTLENAQRTWEDKGYEWFAGLLVDG